MGQSLSKLYIHLIFGTKKRQPIIKKNFEERLLAYLAGTLKKYDMIEYDNNYSWS